MTRYEPTWESLSHYAVPQWYQDAKLGIFIHWGVYGVPAFGNEWYPRNMYIRDRPEFEYHRRTWGRQYHFGYKDFVPMFTGERWDPEAWVTLFQEAGARYVVPVAEHHDGFPMYATDRTRWNAANMGPQRDVISELAQFVRASGLKFGVSSHRAYNWRYYTFEDDFDTVVPTYAGLYGVAHPEGDPASASFLADWYARTEELIDRFQPDLLWFDFGWHWDEFAPFRPRITAYYYNRAEEWGKGVVLNYKEKFPDGVAVYDVERGKLDDIRPYYWQTDTSVSYRSWGYIENDEFKSVTTVVHDLVDIVSKNGNLLLNVGPAPDGTIPGEAAQVLRGVGQWLRVNGEAVYGTRPWRWFGEGDAKVALGHLTERQNEALTAEDVRFTAKEGVLYAIVPLDGQTGFGGDELRRVAKSLTNDALAIERVDLLGGPENLDWSQGDDGLSVRLPSTLPCDHAFVLRITHR